MIVLKKGFVNLQVVFISHPSPRNPSSNRDWLNKTKNLIIDSDLAKYFAV